MKENIIIQSTKCDYCHKGDCYDKCKGCGKDVCCDCKKTHGINFPYSVHFGGSYEGFYCSECLSKPSVTSTEVFKGYKLMSDLRAEYSAWWKDFDARADKAESHLKSMIEK